MGAVRGTQGAESSRFLQSTGSHGQIVSEQDATSLPYYQRGWTPPQPREPGCQACQVAWFTSVCPSLPANSNPLTLKTNGNDTAPPQRAFQKALGVTHRTKDPPAPARLPAWLQPPRAPPCRRQGDAFRQLDDRTRLARETVVQRSRGPGNHVASQGGRLTECHLCQPLPARRRLRLCKAAIATPVKRHIMITTANGG